MKIILSGWDRVLDWLQTEFLGSGCGNPIIDNSNKIMARGKFIHVA